MNFKFSLCVYPANSELLTNRPRCVMLWPVRSVLIDTLAVLEIGGEGLQRSSVESTTPGIL